MCHYSIKTPVFHSVELSQFITNNEIIQFDYTRQDGITKERLVKPVAVLFSEYYFYLIAFMADGSKIPYHFSYRPNYRFEGYKTAF